MIESVNEADIPSICEIYNYYIKNTFITFEEEEVSINEMGYRIKEILKSYPYLVYKENNQVIGYAYANLWKARASYRFSAESTIYLNHRNIKKGVGTALYTALIDEVKKKGIHNLIGGVALPNDASVGLHEKLGFKKCAHFKEVGYKFEQWIDVGYWEYII